MNSFVCFEFDFGTIQSILLQELLSNSAGTIFTDCLNFLQYFVCCKLDILVDLSLSCDIRDRYTFTYLIT